jgi:hypothetical protein
MRLRQPLKFHSLLIQDADNAKKIELREQESDSQNYKMSVMTYRFEPRS